MDTVLEEFKAHSGLLQSYLTLVVQTVTLATGVASGVLAYVVKNEGQRRVVAVALVPAALLCLGLGIGFWRQRDAAAELRDRLVELSKLLKFGLAPHGQILVNALTGLGSW